VCIGCGFKGGYACFVREGKLEEVRSGQAGVDGLDILSSKFGAGAIEVWAPHEIPSSRRVPNDSYVGKYQMFIDFLTKPYETQSTFKLLRLEFTNLESGGKIKYLFGRYHDPLAKKDREFRNPSEILGEKIDGNKGLSRLFLILDLPKNLKSFNLEVTVEASYQGKTELIHFKDHFVRSKYSVLIED